MTTPVAKSTQNVARQCLKLIPKYTSCYHCLRLIISAYNPVTKAHIQLLLHMKSMQETQIPSNQSGKAVPLSRLFLISSVYLPNARSIFLLKCSLRSLMESMSFSS
ncbi:hypothetical protein Hanom_Chr10g00914621 [Helianthus anomalus]